MQRLAILGTAAVALLAVLGTSAPSCPMSVTASDEGLLAAGGMAADGMAADRVSYERHFTVESSASAVGIVSVYLSSPSAASVRVQLVPDRVPEGNPTPTGEAVRVELIPNARHTLGGSSFVDGVRVRVELQTGSEVSVQVEVTAAQDDCRNNRFVKVIDG